MKLSKSLIKCVMAAGLAAALTPGLAFADTYTWTFASADVSGSGTLTAVPYGGPGEYDITGGSGTITAAGFGSNAVTFLPCADPAATCTIVNSDHAGANLTYDNLLFPSNTPGAQLDDNGIVLTPSPLGGSGTGLGVFDAPSQEFFSYGPDGYENLTTPFTVSLVSSTPEPTSLLLIGSGLLGLPIFRRRRA